MADEEKKTTSSNVSVPKKTLDLILERQDALEKETSELKEQLKAKDNDIEMLKTISDKGRLAQYQERNQGTLIHRARVSFWQGNPILAWKMLENECGYIDGRMVIKQNIRLFIDKGEKEPVIVDTPYLPWVQNQSSQEGEITEKSTDKNGEYYVIQMADGRNIKLDIRFINAF